MGIFLDSTLLGYYVPLLDENARKCPEVPVLRLLDPFCDFWTYPGHFQDVPIFRIVRYMLDYVEMCVKASIWGLSRSAQQDWMFTQSRIAD